MRYAKPLTALALGAGAVTCLVLASRTAPAAVQAIKPVLTLIVNDSAHPVPVVNVGASPTVPFQYQLDTSGDTQRPDEFSVPGGYTAVIRYATVECSGNQIGTGTLSFQAYLHTEHGNSGDVYHLLDTRLTGNSRWAASGTTFIPAGEGTSVSAHMAIVGGTGSCEFSVAGEFVPV